MMEHNVKVPQAPTDNSVHGRLEILRQLLKEARMRLETVQGRVRMEDVGNSDEPANPIDTRTLSYKLDTLFEEAGMLVNLSRQLEHSIGVAAEEQQPSKSIGRNLQAL